MKATSTQRTVEDDDESIGYILDHIKYQPDQTFTKGKRCNFCGDLYNWEWCGVVLSKNGRKVKVIGKMLLCAQCLKDGGWL